jgi:hypothetical protein
MRMMSHERAFVTSIFRRRSKRVCDGGEKFGVCEKRQRQRRVAREKEDSNRKGDAVFIYMHSLIISPKFAEVNTRMMKLDEAK